MPFLELLVILMGLTMLAINEEMRNQLCRNVVSGLNAPLVLPREPIPVIPRTQGFLNRTRGANWFTVTVEQGGSDGGRLARALAISSLASTASNQAADLVQSQS